MKVDVIMPKMGESLNEGTVIAWLKAVGDEVKRDEIIYEITTDKVDTEIPSPVEGILIEIKVRENETVPVDTVVAIIETDSAEAVKSNKIEDTSSETQDASEENEDVIVSSSKVKIVSNKFFSPLVMNIANKENIGFEELEKISGTGANGRVSKKDILNYIANREV